MNKYKLFCSIVTIFLVTAITSSLLYNNTIIVKSQKQTTPIYSNGIIEKQTNNENETMQPSNALPTVDRDTISAPSTSISISTPSTPVFNVTTMNYQCTSGDPSTAIQNAINSLPQNRTTPLNVTLQGVFSSVQNIFLEDNINFVGENAVVIGVNNTNMFMLNPNETIFSEVHKVFNIDGYDRQFVDWVNLHNVTFQSIEFQHPPSPASGDYAIYCFQSNSTGWGINDNININNCTFTGFYSGFYGLPINSCFENNVFSNYTSNGFMLPYGLNITIKNNAFDTPATTNPEFDYPTIGLHLLDVNVSCVVCNNSFITGDHSTGLAVVSSTGNITVTNNIFLGNGEPIAVDFYPRPFNTEGLYVYDNIGQPDFSIQ
jgi:hypothetical protein